MYPFLHGAAIELSEPGIILYGKVWADDQVVFDGDFTWTYTSEDGDIVEVTVLLQEIIGKNGDAYSYRACFPAGSDMADETFPANRPPAKLSKVLKLSFFSQILFSVSPQKGINLTFPITSIPRFYRKICFAGGLIDYQ